MVSRVFAAKRSVLIGLIALICSSLADASEPVTPGPDRRWGSRSIQLSISRALFRPSSAIKSGAPVNAAVESAAASWSNVAAVSFRFIESESEAVSDARTGGDGKNLITVAGTVENIALFPKEGNSPPAYTRLFFNRQGSIIEADVVLNPFVQFSTDGSVGTFDLESVLRHELGHVLGLGHSPAMGAVMYGRISQNRELMESAEPKRELSDADVSMVRSLYGAEKASVDCCVSVAGAMSGKPLVVWAEDSSSGRLVAADIFAGARYSLGGFNNGKYRVLAQPSESGPAALVSERELELPTRLNKIVFGVPSGTAIKLIGLNGELGSMPIRLSRGREHQIFVGGVGLDPKSVSFGFSTSAISVVNGTVMAIDYGRGVSAVALSISVSEVIEPGEYSIFAESANGSRRYLIGAVSVN